ncbi:Rho-associated protein kinase 2 [Clonorchis sinensis]|uniref:non-specific serine/threonine protein kinase n=1 Tax=Clonorchis sinensis TaxID=79923 RepID=H2KSI4_CLOSI|nr:Rho-associated protein kinase 2 [Clonorchis sinensis]
MPESSIVCDDLKERLVALEKLLADPLSDCYIERLLDVVIAAVNDSRTMQKSKENEHMLSFCKRFMNVASRLQSYRRQPQDFSLIASLGHGAFGRVQLVREVTTGRVCAMKVLKKSRMLTQHTDYWAEREIMARGESPWIVQLYYAFQDLTSLYMVMEFVPGGNLVGWMEEVEIISEAACRFYAAETVLALSDLHAMGFIHRDLKPDNLLLDAGGHVKLADFGTAIRVDPETQLVHCDAAVGTPDYLSPEVLLSQGAGGGSYGFEVDWWALGVVVYEMLYGDTPFYSETLVNTYAKIMSHANHLKFPDSVQVSEAGLDFMKQLLRDRETRLGSGQDAAANVRKHPWFSSEWSSAQKASGSLDSADLSLVDWSWSTIRACRAPFQPQLTSETDTAYFQLENDDENDHRHSLDDFSPPSPTRPTTAPDSPRSGGGTPAQHSSAKQPLSPGKFDGDRFLHKHPGIQLAFAGFSFSSPHPDHVALLNGIHLAPFAPTLSTEETGVGAVLNTTSLINGNPCLTGSPIEEQEQQQQEQQSRLPVKTNRLSDVADSASSIPLSPSHLIRVQAQLEDALALAELHSNEVMDLTEQLDKAAAQRRELESRLSQREAAHRSALDEAHQRMELVRAEAAAKLAHLEAELSKWKAVAQSEQTARQTAEAAGSIAVAQATARLAKRAAEVADRFAASGSRGALSRVVSPTLPAQSDAPIPAQQANEATEVPPPTDQPESDLLVTTPTSMDTQTVATNLLLTRVEEMAKRAHRAEASAREAQDMLEAEQHFCRLYKETSAEKSDQIRELNRELEELRVLLNESEKKCQRFFEEGEAARRALAEEQQRSLRHREAARVADESAISASHRATLARREAAALRENLEQMKQAYEQEKSKCAAAVNKLHEVMSGTNTPALELMYLASAQSKDGGLFMGSTANRHKLAAILGNRQQQQLHQQSQKIKRLQNEIKRLHWELAASKRENTHILMELSQLREEAHFQTAHHQQHHSHHSRDPSDDLGANGPYSTLNQSSITSRNRSGLFAWNKGEMSSVGSDRTVPFQKTLLPNALSHASSTSSNPELPDNTREVHVRQHSLGERTTFSTQPSNFISPTHTPASVTHPSTERLNQIASLDSTDFSMCGILEFGVKQQRRKKLDWFPRIVKLTATYLAVWDYNHDTVGALGAETRSNKSPSRSSGSISLVAVSATAGPAILEIPLGALYKVGPLDASEAIHERDEALTCAFLVAYDRSYSEVSASPKSAASPGQSNSMTLPRKFSFGSSSIFSAHNPHPPPTPSSSGSVNTRRIVQHQSDADLPRRPTSGSTITHIDLSGPTSPPAACASTPTNPKPVCAPVNQHRGHRFQMMKFRLVASCDLCHKPCWHLVSPPPVLQCLHCQLKFHASHMEMQDCEIPACGKAIVTYWFRCQSKAEQQKWIAHISFAMQFAKSSRVGASTAAAAMLSSPAAGNDTRTENCPKPDVSQGESITVSIMQTAPTVLRGTVNPLNDLQNSSQSSDTLATEHQQHSCDKPITGSPILRHASLPRPQHQREISSNSSTENRMSFSFTHETALSTACSASGSSPKVMIEREKSSKASRERIVSIERASTGNEDSDFVDMSIPGTSIISPTQVS